MSSNHHLLKTENTNRPIKIISLVLIVSLLLQEVCLANSDFKIIAQKAVAVKNTSEAWARQFLPPIPESIATIEDAYKLSDSNKTLILIQDAHTNTSGQFNVANVLDLIFKKRSIKYVFTEAGAGDLSLSFLRKYTDASRRNRVAKSFLRNAKLQGTEYLDLTSNHDFILWGVEDQDLYAKSVETYKEVVQSRSKFQDYLNRIESTIDVLKPRLYNPLLLSFDQKYQKYLKDEISLTDYFDILGREAKKLNVPVNNYSDLRSFGKLRNFESTIDFRQANEEQRKAVLSLSEVDQKILLDATREGHQAFKLLHGTHDVQKAYFAVLEEKVESKVEYPELTKYFGYLKEAKMINPKKILEEQELLENSIFRALETNNDERNLIQASRNLSYLKKLLNLTLTPNEFREYRTDKKSFDITRLTGFLNKKIMDLKRNYDKVMFLENGYEDIIQKCESFYGLTLERDQKFVQNTIQKMDESNQKEAVLIAGGYHTPNLKYLLKENNISFVSLTPQVLEETNKNRYEELLLAQKVEFANPKMTTPSPVLSTNMLWQILMRYFMGMPEDGRTLAKSLSTNSAVLNQILERMEKKKEDRDDQGGSSVGRGGVGVASGWPIQRIIPPLQHRLHKPSEPASKLEKAGARLSSKGRIDTFTESEGENIGKWVVDSLVRTKGVVEEDSLEFRNFKERVEAIFKRLLDTSNIVDSFKLLIIATPEANAMIVPDAKTVVFTKGLIMEMARYERDRKKPFTDDMLAFILAHEIQHFLLRQGKPDEPILREEEDPAEHMSYGDDIFQSLREHAFAHLLGFREEYLADTKALRLMDNAGYNPQEAVRAAEFIKFMQNKEWNERIGHAAKISENADEEIEILEQIRKDKLRRALIPSIVDTHPRTQNRVQSLYLLTINRSYRNETKIPEKLAIPQFGSGEGQREIFWNEMIQNLVRTRITDFAEVCNTVTQAEDLSFLYFLMVLAGQYKIKWSSSYDALDFETTEEETSVAETYLSIPYLKIASSYLAQRDFKGIKEYYEKFNSVNDLNLNPKARLSSMIAEIDEFLNTVDDERAETHEDALSDRENWLSSNKLIRLERELVELTTYLEGLDVINEFLDERVFLNKEAFIAIDNEEHYRRLFTPWGTWKDEQGRQNLIRNKLLMMPFRHPEYEVVLQKGGQLLREENPALKGVRRDMLLWLLYHSYYPNPAGQALMKKIVRNLKRPEDLLSVLRDIPAKQYDDTLLRMAFVGYSGFAYMKMIAVYFVPHLYLSLIKNGAFASSAEMMDFLNKVSNELLYFKAAVSLQYRHPMNLGQHSLYEELFEALFEISFGALKTREDFENLSKFWSQADSIPEGAMNQKKLLKALEDAKVLGGDLDKDIKLISTLIRNAPESNDFANLLLGIYGTTQANFLKIISFVVDSSEYSSEIDNLIMSTSEWGRLTFTGKIKHLRDLNLLLKASDYLVLFNEAKKSTSLSDFMEVLDIFDSYPRGNGAIQSIKAKLGKSGLSFFSTTAAWEVGSASHFNILGQTEVDSIKKILLLERVINRAGNKPEHYQRAISALKGITNEQQNMPSEIRAATKADELRKEFTKRKRDPNYHRINRKPLRDPKELEEENISAIFVKKLGLGTKGWEAAKTESNFAGLSVTEKLNLAESLFPDASFVRDDVLDEILSGARLALEDQGLVIKLTADPIKRVRWGKQFMEELKKEEPSHFGTFENHKTVVLTLFPDFSLERDRQLSHLVDSYDSPFLETESIAPYFLEGNEEYSTEEAIVFGSAGMETFRDYMHLTPPRDKVELLTWLLDLQTKPDVVDIMEQSTGYKASAIKDAMGEAGDDENRLFLQEILLGQNGILSAGAESDMQFLLDRVFPLVFPDELEMDPTTRGRLKAIFDAIFRFAEPKRRADLLIALSNAKYKKLTMPQMVRVFLQAYGSLGIKIGQYLAMRTSLLPKEIREELLHLTDKADPILKQRVYETVQVEFGVQNPEEVFPKIGKRLGSASFKQVHEGEIDDQNFPDGRRPITVKIIRPAAKKEIMSDLASFDALVHYIHQNFDFFGFTLPRDMSTEIRRRTLEEIDFGMEAPKQERIRLNVEKRWVNAETKQAKRDDFGYTLGVPQVHGQYTHKTVFVDDRAPGIPLTSEGVVAKAHSFSNLSKIIVKEVLDEIFYDGFYQADPHPGNIFVSDEKIISFIDFGITGILGDLNRDRLFDLIEAAMQQDRTKLLNLVIEFYEAMEPANRPQVSLNDLEQMIDRMFGQGFEPHQLGKSLYDILDEINKIGIELPSEFYTLLGTLTEMDYWFSKMDNPLSFILPAFMGYKSFHDAKKSEHPIERISTEKLDSIKQALSQAGRQEPIKTAVSAAEPVVASQAPQAGVSKAPSAKLVEIWKAWILKQGTHFRFKGKEAEEWTLAYDTSLSTEGELVLERISENEIIDDSGTFHHRARFILDQWMEPRLPFFENDGNKFADEEGKIHFNLYFDALIEDDHILATKTEDWSYKIERKGKDVKPITIMKKLFSRLETYDTGVAYKHYLEGKEAFEKYLFRKLGMPKRPVKGVNEGIEGLYEGIAKEINKGHVELRAVKLTDDAINGLDVFQDEERWVDFSTFRITKGSQTVEKSEAGARLTIQTERESLIRAHQEALNHLTLELVRIRQEKEFEKPFAVLLDEKNPILFKINVFNEGGVLTRVDLVLVGDETPLSSIDKPFEILNRIRTAAEKTTHQEQTAQGLVILLNISAMKSEMAIEAKETRAALGHALPIRSLNVISDNLKFTAQVRILIEQILRTHRNPTYKRDLFFLAGMDSLNEAQRGIVYELVNQANAVAGDVIQVKEADGFQGVVVQYVVTDGMEKPPSNDGRTITIPIAGLQGDALLGWYEAIRAGGVLGGAFAGYFDGKKIDFEKVHSNDIPQSVFDFYNSRSVNPVSSKALFRDLLSGQATVQQLMEFSFFLPLAQRVPIEVLMQGARLVLRTVGIST